MSQNTATAPAPWRTVVRKPGHTRNQHRIAGTRASARSLKRTAENHGAVVAFVERFTDGVWVRVH